jgi:hypothetical protein
MLTALKIDNAKPREKVYRLADGHGLSLQIDEAPNIGASGTHSAARQR